MGQYYKGEKIGTCESMYYLTLPEAQELARQGARDDDGISFQSYLTDNVTMFRFDFPGETKESRYKNYDRGFMVLASEDVEAGHTDKWIAMQHKGGGYNVNICLPCPYSQEFKDLGIKTSVGGFEKQTHLQVRFQAIRHGEEKTIFECARCGQLQRFDNVDIARIKDATREYYEAYKPKSWDTEGKTGNKGLYEFALKVVDKIS